MLLEILRGDRKKTSLVSLSLSLLSLSLSVSLFVVLLEDVRYVCVIGKKAGDDLLLIAGRYQLTIFSAAYRKVLVILENVLSAIQEVSNLLRDM